MKMLGALLACAALAWSARADGAPAKPKERGHSDAHAPSAAGLASPQATANSSVVTMNPYVVNESRLRATSPETIRRDTPPRTGIGLLDALQTGVLLRHKGRNVTTEFLTHGESDPGGSGRVKLGFRLSW